jgi:hypothetical protein
MKGAVPPAECGTLLRLIRRTHGGSPSPSSGEHASFTGDTSSSVSPSARLALDLIG